MTEVFVNERGVLVVPLVPHTCDYPDGHPFTRNPCPAHAEMDEYWASFEQPATPVTPTPIDFDSARDLAFESEGFEDFLDRMEEAS